MKDEKNCTASEYRQGYFNTNNTYHCLYCQTEFTEGVIYPVNELMGTADYAMEQHIIKQHNGALFALLQQKRTQLGISESQQEILKLFAHGLSDGVIAQRLGISNSTVRNHRFKLKEKYQQAKQFLAVMDLLELDNYLIPHAGAKMLDERYQITPEERQKAIQTFVNEDGWIRQIPSKEKRKIILLSYLITFFDQEKNYSEKAINDILKQHVEDYVSVRRYLIEYGFMDRTNDGKTYWLRG